MQEEAKIYIEKLGSEYLTSVQLLSEEFACATAAIARNDLEALEKHIKFQQDLCARLLALDRLHEPPSANSAVWSSVQVALRTLIRNKQIYSKLLVTSSLSHQVLLTLCNAYNDSSSHAAERSPIARSLSCEI
jgi:hypothetical protein